jgi:hypothetical protein
VPAFFYAPPKKVDNADVRKMTAEFCEKFEKVGFFGTLGKKVYLCMFACVMVNQPQTTITPLIWRELPEYGNIIDV